MVESISQPEAQNNTDSQRQAGPREGGAVQVGVGADYDLDAGLQGSKGAAPLLHPPLCLK